jgi:hypothetical protein
MKRLSDVALATLDAEPPPPSVNSLTSIPIEVLEAMLRDHYLSPNRSVHSITQLRHIQFSLASTSRLFRSLVHQFLVPNAIQFLCGTILAKINVETLKKFGSLRGLSLCESKRSNNCFALPSGDLLPPMTNLTFLRVQGDGCYVRDWHLTPLTNIKELRVEDNRTLSPMALDALGHSTALERLVLANAQVRLLSTSWQRAWRPLLRSLEITNYRHNSLNLSDFTGLTALTARNCVLEGLSALSHLHTLSLDACGHGQHAFDQMTRLEVFQLYNSPRPIDVEQLRALSVVIMRELRLDETTPPEVISQLLFSDKGLTNLTSLSLTYCRSLAVQQPFPTTLRELRLFGYQPVFDLGV